MVETDGNTGAFELDPDHHDEFGELAEAFIQEEVDQAFCDEVDCDYLERLVDQAESEPPAEIATEEYEAAIEVAEFILEQVC